MSKGAPSDSPSSPRPVQMALGGYCVLCDRWVYPTAETPLQDPWMHRWCAADFALGVLLALDDDAGPF